MEFESEKYIAQIREGVLRVDLLEEHTLRRTTFKPDGTTEEEVVNLANADQADARLIRGMNRMPAFCAAYRGKGDWSCDISAGFQRLRGNRSGRAVGQALKQCGFDKSTIGKIMKFTRHWTGAHCPRQW